MIIVRDNRSGCLYHLSLKHRSGCLCHFSLKHRSGCLFHFSLKHRSGYLCHFSLKHRSGCLCPFFSQNSYRQKVTPRTCPPAFNLIMTQDNYEQKVTLMNKWIDILRNLTVHLLNHFSKLGYRFIFHCLGRIRRQMPANIMCLRQSAEVHRSIFGRSVKNGTLQ